MRHFNNSTGVSKNEIVAPDPIEDRAIWVMVMVLESSEQQELLTTFHTKKLFKVTIRYKR